ncbi:FtsX-like permease family protein [Fimbriiglobus ruber]|uniref:ABC transporter permease protein n=1 Tax=Fimbriiglobus ruber TaxID=1908690 RepID=A0A225D3U1_9BACT|nr:FtsX-like permease family protein [Fimbriiglobus ruber]OWK35623.1 ABC transporter permease protein [Fimbriiglobus ruber]
MIAARLALSNMVHDRTRAAVSVTGAAFAVVLVFMQLGFLGAVRNTATLLYDRLDFDLLLTSSEYLDFSRPGNLDRERLAQARSAAGVVDVVPLTSTQVLWRNPTNDPARGGKRWAITVLAVDPGRLDATFLPRGTGVFRDPADLASARATLGRLNVVMLDLRSRPDFGDPGNMPPGTITEINNRRVELGGYFELGTGFSYTGLLLMNEDTYTTLTGNSSRSVSLGLVKLAPGDDPSAAAARVAAALPPDVLVFTRQQITDLEIDYWVSKTAVGKFFYFGVVLALLVGAIFVYQMMVADIKKHLPEYATLKAIGYTSGYLFRVVTWQAVFLSAAGYAVGYVAALGLYAVTRTAAHFPVDMTAERMASVLALTVGMCVGSGLVAVRKALTADPADLF